MAIDEVVIDRAPAAAAPRRAGIDWRALGRIGLVAAQLVLLLLVIRSYRLMPSATADVMKLVAVGFLANALAPKAWRLHVFIGLSLIALIQTMGWSSGLQVLGLSAVLVGITRVPTPWWARIAMLCVVVGVLTFARGGLIDLPISQAVWPILGSMFMFRMIVYVYDVRHDAKLATWSGAASYFLMLPNPVFPFFPVVDYKTFRRTYYDAEATKIYQTGVAWMVRGIVHLIGYRFVYYYLTLAPEDVQTSSDLVRYVVANYALYLRVSGTFHLIVGILHLFGFNLPLTNNLYMLASSFTDYWRRVNIYWKDFMMKVFYYPSYFQLRRAGPTAALVLATVVVFIATTILHSWQWFWLRGDWYMSPMDIAFWTVLGVAVIGNVVWEAKRGRKRSLGTAEWTLRGALGKVGRVLLMFTILSTLWSLWSAPSVAEWFGMWSVWNVGAPLSLRMTLILAAALGAYLLGSYVLSSTPSGRSAAAFATRVNLRESSYLAIAVLALLLVAGDSRTRARFDVTALMVVEDLQHERLNRRDQEQLERGYYENLFGVENTNPELAELYQGADDHWVSLWRTPAARESGDLRRIELVPNVSMVYKGEPFTTNAYGMRDRARSLTAAPGSYRFGVFGASTTMGSGVDDEGSYPALLENAYAAAGDAEVEFLNFAVESYNAVEQVAAVDMRLAQFEMDGMLYIAHETEFEKTLGSVARLVESRTDLVYPELRDIVERAGVEPGLPRTIALRRLGTLRDEIIAWAYRQMAAESRAAGVLPVWAFVPMPVPGTGPCPPGSAQLFCFGNTARPGAAADASDPRVRRLFELAEEAGFVTLDLSNVYGDVDLKTLWIAATDGHPNAVGHELIANGLYTALRASTPVARDMSETTTRSAN